MIRPFVAVALALAASACAPSASETPPPATAPSVSFPAPPAPASTPSTAPAPGPLSELCASVPQACAPFPAASRDAEACGKAKRCTVANVGSCGALKFIERVEGFSSTVRYYDAGGALVWSCSGNLEHGGNLCFGAPVPACTRNLEKKLGPAE